MASNVVLLPDAGPLITLAYADALDLLEPGLVPIEQWRSDGDPPFLPEPQLIPLFGAVGRKP